MGNRRGEEKRLTSEVRGVVSLLHLFLELGVRVLVDRDVLEHALQFARVLEPTSVLELADHGRLGVVGGRSLSDQSVRQHFRVELLEHVLVLDVLEDRHLARSEDGQVSILQPRARELESYRVCQSLLHVCVLGLFVALLEQRVGVLCEELGGLVRCRARLVSVDELSTSLANRKTGAEGSVVAYAAREGHGGRE